MAENVLRPSLLLVREWEQQMSSSGCCGRLEGDLLLWRGERCFPDRRRIMEGAGVLYRAVRDRYDDDVEIRVVDPRNQLALLPVLIRDFRRHRVPFREAVRTLVGLDVQSVVVNGRLLSRGGWPDPEVLLRRLAEAFDGRLAAPSETTPPAGAEGPTGGGAVADEGR